MEKKIKSWDTPLNVHVWDDLNKKLVNLEKSLEKKTWDIDLGKEKPRIK